MRIFDVKMSSEARRVPPHQTKEVELKSSDDEDTYELMLEKSGCRQYHYRLQDCFYDNNNDWRKCQKEMAEFRDCMANKGDFRRN